MNLLERLIDLYAPHNCLGCGSDGSLACIDCLMGMQPAETCCFLCRTVSPLGRTCDDCRQSSTLVSVNSAATYEGLAKELVWKLKFDRAQAAATIMADLMAQQYGRYVANDVLIVPVPTASSRVRKRGYDQAVLLARAFAARTGCRYAPLLVRLGSQEQIGAGRTQRREQLRGAFCVKRPRLVPGTRLLLIDDVFTTGATMQEAAGLLGASGARRVGALTFVRA